MRGLVDIRIVVPGATKKIWDAHCPMYTYTRLFRRLRVTVHDHAVDDHARGSLGLFFRQSKFIKSPWLRLKELAFYECKVVSVHWPVAANMTRSCKQC